MDANATLLPGFCDQFCSADALAKGQGRNQGPCFHCFIEIWYRDIHVPFLLSPDRFVYLCPVWVVHRNLVVDRLFSIDVVFKKNLKLSPFE